MKGGGEYDPEGEPVFKPEDRDVGTPEEDCFHVERSCLLAASFRARAAAVSKDGPEGFGEVVPGVRLGFWVGPEAGWEEVFPLDDPEE